MTQTDHVKDRRSALELSLLARGEFSLVADAYEQGAKFALLDPALRPAERSRRWHDQMASAAVLRVTQETGR